MRPISDACLRGANIVSHANSLRFILYIFLAAPVLSGCSAAASDEDCVMKDRPEFMSCDGKRIKAEDVTIDCGPARCLAQRRFIAAYHAWHIKQGLGTKALLVDIRGRQEAFYNGAPSGIDAHVPFMEPVAVYDEHGVEAPRAEINMHFAEDLDEVMRERRLRFDAPVILLCRSG